MSFFPSTAIKMELGQGLEERGESFAVQAVKFGRELGSRTPERRSSSSAPQSYASGRSRYLS